MKIGAQIKRFRMLRGMSQLDLALAIGYNGQGNVSRIEKDEQWPDGERLEAIAKALDCKVSEFFVYAEYENDESESANHNRISEKVADYIRDEQEPTLDSALRAIEFELPNVDPRTQARLAVDVFSANQSKINADRIVDAINSLVRAVERMNSEA